jgi:hypothetical protein
MLSTAGGRVKRKPPPVLLTTASSGEGVPALVEAVEQHRLSAREPEQVRARARSQLRRAVADVATRRVQEFDATWEAALTAVADRETDPVTAAESLLTDAYWALNASKEAAEAERLEQAIHGGLALEAFPAVAAVIEREVERGKWYEPDTLMEDLFFSNELDQILPLIEAKARESRPFRRQLVYTMHSFGGKGGPAIDRLFKLADEFRAEFADELKDS